MSSRLDNTARNRSCSSQFDCYFHTRHLFDNFALNCSTFFSTWICKYYKHDKADAQCMHAQSASNSQHCKAEKNANAAFSQHYVQKCFLRFPMELHMVIRKIVSDSKLTQYFWR